MNNKPQQDLALAKLAHEFRSPLSAIMGFTSILLQNKWGHLEEKELLYLDRILYSSQHLLNLANGIMNISKGEIAPQYENTDVSALVQQVAHMLEGQALEKNIEIKIDIPGQLKPLLTIPEKLKIILINLISNAIKFTPSGTVSIHIDSDTKTHKITSIAIEDTGPGIPKEKLVKLMQPLSLDASREWDPAGKLGLAITYSLCDQLHYRLEAESHVGKGSTFRLTT